MVIIGPQLLYPMDHAYFMLILVHGLKINHIFEINHIFGNSGLCDCYNSVLLKCG